MPEISPLDAIDHLLSKFKLERYFYLFTTGICFLILLGCSIFLLFWKQQVEIVIGMFGTTGVISYACSQILKMWSDCTSIITKFYEK